MLSTDFLCSTTSHYCKTSILAQIIPPPQQTHLKGVEENQRLSLQYKETQRSSLQSSLNNSTPPPACSFLLGATVAKGTVDFIFGKVVAVLQGFNLHARRSLPNQSSIYKKGDKRSLVVFTLIFKVFGFQSPFLWFSDGEEKRWAKNNIIIRIQG